MSKKSIGLEAQIHSLVWAEVDLQKLRNNFLQLRKFVNDKTKFLAVVKANAYGHGIQRISKELEKLGVDYLGVSNLNEAVTIRRCGVMTPILVFGYVCPEDIGIAVDNHITLTVCEDTMLSAVASYATKTDKTVPVHIQIDTGLRMYGVDYREVGSFINKVLHHSNIYVEGVYSHFTNSEDKDTILSFEQLDLFNNALKEIISYGVNPPYIHIANGAAVINIPESHYTMVRTGTFLYGNQTKGQNPKFKPEQIMTLKTKVVHKSQLSPSDQVGYEKSFITSGIKEIACLPIGYGDGFRQKPHWEYVLINGQQAPVINGVSMDKTAVDISKIKNVEIGSEVVLLGTQKETITINQVAQMLNAANYEILSGLTSRVKRIYLNETL